jgi:hypothetical protein
LIEMTSSFRLQHLDIYTCLQLSKLTCSLQDDAGNIL